MFIKVTIDNVGDVFFWFSVYFNTYFAWSDFPR